ncbi:unnamed protein product, partial [marine sediment metagenome]
IFLISIPVLNQPNFPHSEEEQEDHIFHVKLKLVLE